jgi:hypothetical protein
MSYKTVRKTDRICYVIINGMYNRQDLVMSYKTVCSSELHLLFQNSWSVQINKIILSHYLWKITQLGSGYVTQQIARFLK